MNSSAGGYAGLFSAMVGSNHARRRVSGPRATDFDCGHFCGSLPNAGSYVTCHQLSVLIPRPNRMRHLKTPMSSGSFNWQDLLYTDAPKECSLKAALFTTYDHAQERFLAEHLLPFLL